MAILRLETTKEHDYIESKEELHERWFQGDQFWNPKQKRLTSSGFHDAKGIWRCLIPQLRDQATIVQIVHKTKPRLNISFEA